MDRAREIIAQIAKKKRVEEIAAKACKRPAAELEDLVQIVYFALLKTRPEMILDLYDNNQLDFYIVRMVENQFHSTDRRYYRDYGSYAKRARPLTEKEYEKEDN